MKAKLVKMTLFSFLSVLVLGSQVVEASDGQVTMLIKNLQKQMNQLQETVKNQNHVIEKQEGQIRELRDQLNNASIKGSQVTTPSGATVVTEESHPWLEGLQFKGDFRLRYEGQTQSSGATSGGAGIDNDRNRFRYRFRWGFEKTFNEEMKVGVRLASGSVGTITSRNETFDSQFGLKSIGIDRAYATYTPNWAKGDFVKKLQITGGKFNNPFREGTSSIMWDSDVALEGLYEKIDVELYESEDFSIDGSLLMGQLIVEEGSTSGNSEDAELFAYQAGFKTTINDVLGQKVWLKNYVSFYDYNEITSPGNFGSARGNFSDAGGLSAESFDIIGVKTSLSFDPEGFPPVSLMFDWMKNINENAIPSLGGGQDKAWYLWGKLGKAKKQGSWEAGLGYYWIEANAVPGVFSQGEFGTVNTRGMVLKAAYALTDSLKFKTAFYANNRILGDSLSGDRERRLLQTDLVWAF